MREVARSEAPSLYGSLTDERLCALAKGGDRRAEERLVERCHRMVRSMARPYYLAGGDSDDLLQEGMIGLLRAVREYDGEKAASFRTFAEICVRNRLRSAVRSAARNKHSPLNQSVSLDMPFLDAPAVGRGGSLPSQPDPEELIIGREGARDALRLFRAQLSEFESTILAYYLDGLTTAEMAEETGRSPKSVDNAVQRIRRKAARRLPPGDLSGS